VGLPDAAVWGLAGSERAAKSKRFLPLGHPPRAAPRAVGTGPAGGGAGLGGVVAALRNN